MTSRRSRGEGGLHWDESRQRWIATASLGFDGRGKRITRKASGRIKTEAKDKLRDILRDREEGVTTTATNYTVADAVREWLEYGLAGRSAETIKNYRTIAETHVIKPLGAKRLKGRTPHLSADDVDRWLRAESHKVSTRTLRLMHSILNRAIRRTMARDKAKRNVVILCEVPVGQPGRPSKSLTLDQAESLLNAAERTTPRELRHSFVSLLSQNGVRIEDISRLVGHSGTAVTERVYRHQLQAILDEGTIAMDDLFPLDETG